jgi:Fe2+ transport system protein B
MSFYYIFIILLYIIPCITLYTGVKKEAGSITPMLFVVLITWPYWMLNYIYDRITGNAD